MAAVTDDPNTTDEKQSDSVGETDLGESAETVAKNSFIGQLFIKIGYLYLFGLNLTVLFYDNVPISLQVLSTSVVCILLGSFGSLRHPESAEAKEVEKLKPKDAYMFPIFGSLALCSFYFAIKYLPQYVIDVFAQLFFVLMSTFAVQALFDELFLLFTPKFIFNIIDIKLFVIIISWKNVWTIPIMDKKLYIPVPSLTTNNKIKKKDNEDLIDTKLSNVVSLIIGIVAAYLWYLWDQYWLFNNLIGISLSIQAISFLNPGSYYTASVLLSLLFFYDIFWVFGTDVMVTVAKNLKAPIKLVFPRPAVTEKPNMLGLGDIVLPGIYIALLLRYDVQRSYKSFNFKTFKNNKDNSSKLPPLNILTFYLSLFLYLVSLIVCLYIMWVYESPQPALLYIVPFIIIPIIGFTFFRGDFNQLWAYDEEADDSKKKN